MTTDNRQFIVVTDVRMRFGSMVVFIVKLTLASIPAAIILALLGLLVFTVLGGALGALIR